MKWMILDDGLGSVEAGLANENAAQQAETEAREAQRERAKAAVRPCPTCGATDYDRGAK